MSHSLQVGARICKLELRGESNIYVCPRDEYCCNIGCCMSPTFQFYQLWYYWFMVFFMFLVCSGGQWWYRYVMQGRCASVIAPPAARRASYPRQARVAYTPARDTVVLHHLWKPYPGPGMNGPPPAYSQSATSSSGCTMGGPKPSPYMQLYGPPPSYESVIGSDPAPVHGPQSSGGPSQVQAISSSHIQPLDPQHVTTTLVQQQQPTNQILTQAQTSQPVPHVVLPVTQDRPGPSVSLSQQSPSSILTPQIP